jgi:hypothetical protein
MKNFLESLLFWKGRKKGMIHTRDITWNDIRVVFFPRTFSEKYNYLGVTIGKDEGIFFDALYPLVLALDYRAKPKWCPRWFLRFLHLFGSDHSIVRVRNRRLHNLEQKLKKGIQFTDWKTKWTYYDLRISVAAPQDIQNLAEAIENNFYKKGREEELIRQIKTLNPDANPIRGSIKMLEKELEKYQRNKKYE